MMMHVGFEGRQGLQVDRFDGLIDSFVDVACR